MDIHLALADLGLSEGEIKVYLALLKLGSCPVSEIKEATGLHRTTIYDFVEKLLNRGLVNYVVQKGVNYYSATHPSKLLDYLKEKEDKITGILPELIEMSKLPKAEVNVEVHKGKEGLKNVLLDALRCGEEVVGIGVDEELYKKNLPHFIEQFQRIEKEKGMTERIITKTGSSYLFDQEITKYRFLSPSQFSPLSTMMWKDRLMLVLWEPSLFSILIKSDELAQAYRKHFENLWRQDTALYSGDDEVKMFFETGLAQMRQGDEWLVFGTPPLTTGWVAYFDGLVKRMDDLEVPTRWIFDERNKAVQDYARRSRYTNCRTLPPEYVSPTEVNIVGDLLAMVIWDDEPRAIVIRNKKVADSFRKYFEVMWNIAK